MAQSSALVNVYIYDKCCRKIILNWTILEVHGEDSIEDYFSRVSSGVDVELEGHALIDVHVGKDKTNQDRVGNLSEC